MTLLYSTIFIICSNYIVNAATTPTVIECGGLTGKPCPDGMICKYGPDGGAADKMGICIKDPDALIPCGTRANLKCPKGMFCQLDESAAWDGPGWCVSTKYCPIGCDVFFNGCSECQCENGEAICPKRKACTKLQEPECRKEIEEIPCNKTLPCPSMDHQTCTYLPGSNQGTCKELTCPRGCKSFHDGCNLCGCLPNGKISICTEMFCEKKTEPKCLDKPDDDLTCGGIAGKQCPQGEGYWCKITETYPDAMGTCVKDKCPKGCKSWFDGCNTCSCANPANPGCTKIACDVYKEPQCLDDGGGDDCSDENAIIQRQMEQIMSSIQNLFYALDRDSQVKLLAILGKIAGGK